MGKRQWTTPEQRTWLEALVPAWYEKWPTAAPSDEEIKAEGSAEKALASKRKATDSRIKFWFHNHTRGSSSGAGTRGVLKLCAPSKVMQPWQAYLNKFQNTKLKEKIDKAWQQYLSEVPEGQKPEKTLFEIRNKLAQQLYEAETAEVKREVEEHRKSMRVNKEASDLAERNRSFQSSIDKLPRTLQVATESIAKQTGWNVLVIVGGPNPRLGGKITTLALHQGTTTDGKTFEGFLGNDRFEKKVMSKFDDFLHESFDQGECTARALNIGSKENTPVLESITLSDSDSDDDDGDDDDDYERSKTRKNAKSRSSSGTTSMRLREFEQEKAKRIARNKKLLLEMIGPVEGIQDVDQDPRECGRDPELASLGDVRAETGSAPRDQTDDGIGVAGTGESTAGLGLEDATAASPSESANHTCCENLTTAEILPTAVDDLETQSTVDGLGIGAVLEDGQAQAHVLASSQGITAPSAGDCSRSASPFITLDPPADSFYANQWFAPWLAHFRQVSTDASWQALVTEWAQYEALNPPDGRLPTASRPEEVHWWIKRKRVVSLLPSIEKPSEFGAMWMLWWVKMQPTWRGGESLVKTLPTEANWEPILRGGSNGLSMVVMALSWWVHAMGLNGQQDLELLVAINDVKWALSELVVMLSTASTNTRKKHSREETMQEELVSKRARMAV
ncbi:hypothetical protein BGW80DRAFT_1566314 [Lactifluus volemus]|nr:hypothetical protein BGW80DRAFT_1566314 [Lactifluus volemus]